MVPMGTRFVNPLLKYTLPETNSSSMKIGPGPQKEMNHLPTINFPGSGCEQRIPMTFKVGRWTHHFSGPSPSFFGGVNPHHLARQLPSIFGSLTETARHWWLPQRRWTISWAVGGHTKASFGLFGLTLSVQVSCEKTTANWWYVLQ